jgi:glycosyltransferase involved in cell wall biosynthesis
MGEKKMEKISNDILISIIVPVYNEEKYIEKCVESILAQDVNKEVLEVIFVDGGSDDRTKEILKNYSDKYRFIKVFDNPGRKTSFGANVGIKNSTGKYIVRMDAHAEYARNYVRCSVEILEKTDADNVGGPTVAEGRTKVQRIIAAAYHSEFALGGGKCYREGYEGYADTVFAGAFRRETLFKVGLYDATVGKSEDNDLNYRIIQNGGKIYISPKIRSTYYPRSSYAALFKQYFEYGFWKVAFIKKHRKPARISHLVPVTFVLFLMLEIILSLSFKRIEPMFLPVLCLYVFLDGFFSFSARRMKKISEKLSLMWAHFVIHIAYGLGFFAGIFRFFITF